jgi:uncharacterized protein (DUF305 family)
MFLDMMSKHHVGAVKWAQAAKTQAQHQEAIDFAAKIVDVRQKEIAQMKKWQAQWKLAAK